MAQTGFTPISIYYSSTASNTPTAGNLVAGELAINTADGKLFYKDSSGVVQTIATKGAGTVAGSTGYVQYNNAGALGASSNFYWDITNSRLGVGTSSPIEKFNVNGAIVSTGPTTLTASSSAGIFDYYTSSSSTRILSASSTTGSSITFFTNAASAGLLQQMTLDSTGNLGIGTSSPSGKLHVEGSSTNGISSRVSNSNSTTYSTLVAYGSNGDGVSGWANSIVLEAVAASTGNLVLSAYNNNMVFQTGTGRTERMRIASDGKVGINTSSFATGGAYLTINTAAQMGIDIYRSDSSAQYNGIRFRDTSNGTTYGSMGWDSAGLRLDGNAGTMYFSTSSTERMRIDSSGNVFIGITSQISLGKFTVYQSNTAQRAIETKIPTTSAADHLAFFSSSGQAGQITITNLSTAYGTSSDYRLKKDVTPMTGALDTVLQLKPVTYKWKIDGSAGQGFIAHELQEVVPDCVIGKKDGIGTEKYEISPAIPAEIDEDGKVIKEAVEAVIGEREVPQYQGIDTSFLVATLTAAIQELTAKVIALEAKVG